MSIAIAFEQDVVSPVKKAGQVSTRKGSSKLYVDFYYNGVRVVKSTGLKDTSANRETMQGWLDRQLEKIAAGTFVYAEAFPGASEKEKTFHAAREGWEYRPDPEDILFRDYVRKWDETVLVGASVTKKRDFRQIIDCWLLPYFSDMTFRQVTSVELQRFINQLSCKRGKQVGQQLTRSRASNILIPLKAIWSDACEEHQWDISDPFRFTRKHLPKGGKKHPEGFRHDEWIRIIQNANPYYVPHLEIMIMTGMIASELAGFRKEDIVNDEMVIQNSIVLGHEKGELKTKYRKRRLPITKAIQERLNTLSERAKEKYLFTMEDGSTFNGDLFRKTVWKQALKKATVDYRQPYSARHSFAAWALVVGMDGSRLARRFMGHSSKQMVYEVYGSYIPGVEKDSEKIREYFGEDFA